MVNDKRQVITGLFWTFGERITAQMVSIVVSIILARLLDPSDYGVVALVMIFITIANVFVSNGLGSALIQKDNADDLDFSSVFYINIAVSIVLYVIIFLTAPFIAEFYGFPVMKSVLRVLGIRIIVAAINSVQHAYVSRNMLFSKFFWSTLIGTLISGVIGVYLARTGYGVWALVAQYLTNTCADTIVLWFTLKWRPAFACSFSRAKRLISFGGKLLVSALLDAGYNQLRSLLIGKVYTKEDLAYYNQGEKYPVLIVTNINASISSVLFPALSKEQDNKTVLLRMTRRAIQVSSYIMWPMMVGLGVCAEPLVRLLLTEKWLPSVPYLRVFCFNYGFWPIHTANLQALNAMGRSDLFLRLEVIKKGIGIVLLLIAYNHGPFAIAVSLAVGSVISCFVNAFPNIKLLNYSYKIQIGDILFPFLLSCLMGICILPIQFAGLGNAVTLILQFAFGVVVYIGLSIITKSQTFNYLYSVRGLFTNKKNLR